MTRYHELFSREASRTTGYVLTCAAAVFVVTCTGAAPIAPARVAHERPPAAAPSHVAPSAPATPTSSAPASPAAPERAGSLPQLAHFFMALHALERHERHEPVRVLWFGDSHTAADFWPQAVRTPLQERFGNAGPGYVYIGVKVYRHGAVSVTRDGRWKQAPKAPSYWERQDDGIFGLGGIRMSPQDGESVAKVALLPGAITGTAHWDLIFRMPATQASFRVKTETLTVRIDSTAGDKAPSGLSHYVFETPAGATVTLDSAQGSPEFFGAIVESSEPGVVVDTLGINGARVNTPLAWEANSWIEELRRRKPTLVVLAYGTNEVGDAVAPFRYGPHYDALVGRVRQAAPEADCLIIGPTDRVGPDWTTNPRVFEIDGVEQQAAQRLGCAFVSNVSLMGGAGSLKRWADQSPPLAGSDRIHLTPAGYKQLGTSAAQTLLGAYAPH